ncbi:hypothetical protein N752_01995 [Desulforamulus aquiferis]|nr:DUF3656 domain-containing protein [Desulforamulus aquiferis]RYD06925.1 hypothetical protein N752_01995 [Desulforamulus aquiferis]
MWVTEGGRSGIEVNSILLKGKQIDFAPAGSLVGLAIPGKIKPGDRVFKTNDASLMELARETYSSARETKKLPLHFHIRARVGEPLYMKVADDTGLTVEGYSEEVGQEAQKRPITEEFLREQLDRLGNTPFSLGGLKADLEGKVMVPMREINELRRKVLAELEQKRLRGRKKPGVAQHLAERRIRGALKELEMDRASNYSEPLLSVNVTDLTSLEAAVSYGADMVYFGGESYRSKGLITEQDIKAGAEFCQKNGASLVLSSSRIMNDQQLSKFIGLLNQVRDFPLAGVLVGNLGLLKILRDFTDKPVVADFSLNVFNSATLHYLKALGVSRATLSPELTMKQVQELARTSPLPLEVLVQGAVPMMTSKYCPVGSILGGLAPGKKCGGPCHKQKCGLKDRMGLVFPLEVDQNCHMHLFNAKDLCMIEDVFTLAQVSGVLRIEAKKEDHGYVAKAVNHYRQALARFKYGHKDDYKDREAKEDLEELSNSGLTKGHFFRGVV